MAWRAAPQNLVLSAPSLIPPARLHTPDPSLVLRTSLVLQSVSPLPDFSSSNINLELPRVGAGKIRETSLRRKLALWLDGIFWRGEVGGAQNNWIVKRKYSASCELPS
ncbi:uncharacterized protein PGTG_22442 [Puccinia graminis f. sp. tritici CRL 75-36-700-3]|uniref:Uncharacterized protein n=1 Tax=Puccinia graminis f. sp. tritici (strain CRL 75-36-700-3 / race SCCL) TaxID=418459 RepID=H6QUG3_PUCGT|nr:uncharacterized protein PGTG_22442 [Puccinia graminis f. sp. tritici CRL 75-36-700-3]EHS64626.1 hypothetical protein PGTG_22442 [Puccinia graminis f. sp. tritici CRL 75-36-700-3]